MRSYSKSVFEKITLAWRFIACLILSSLLTAPTLAQGEGGENPPAIIPETNDLAQQEVEQRLRAFGNDMMGDQIDPSTGSLIFSQTDVSLPGNNGLEVAVRRKLTGIDLQADASGFFANWTLDVPNISMKVPRWVDGFDGNGDNLWPNRCSAPTEPGYISLGYQTFLPDEYWDGMSINIPGQSSGRILDNPDPSSQIWGSQTLPTKSTTGHLHITCTGSGTNEGFIVKTPDGTTYRFDELKFVPTKSVKKRGGNILNGGILSATLEVNLGIVFATNVTDKHGNTVDYNYDPSGNLTSIVSSDGRVIDLAYGTHGISTVTANGRSWTYHYTPSEHTRGNALISHTLKRVTQPDGKEWLFELDDFRTNILATGIINCDGFDASFDLEITHPYGVVGQFKIDKIVHGKTDVPWSQVDNTVTPPDGCHGEENNLYSFKPTFNTLSVMEKKLLGLTDNSEDPNYQQIWTYDYVVGFFNFRDPGNIPTPRGEQDYKSTTVTQPDGSKIKYYHNRRWGVETGQLHRTVKIDKLGNVVETVENEYVVDSALFTEDYFPFIKSDRNNTATSSYLTMATTTRDGDEFVTESSYDVSPSSVNYSYGRPLTNISSSDIPNSLTRTTVTVLKHIKDNWILGLPENMKVNDRQVLHYDYDDIGQKTAQFLYEELADAYASFDYHDNGTLAWVENALGDRHSVAEGDWHRGVPQKVTRPDLTFVQQIADDNGWITSTVDARLNTTIYNRDPDMGRLTEIDLPGGYDSTAIDYNFGADEIVQTITKGDAITTITYDKMFRPVLEKTRDDSTGWESYVNTNYDASGQISFTSFPSTNDSYEYGTYFKYDGLGRALEEDVRAEGETGSDVAIEKTYAYLPDGKSTVEDAQHNITTTWKNGFGEVIQIDQPENTTTIINRNAWGQIETAKQKDRISGLSQTQSYDYDDQQNLCYHHTPSGGATLSSFNLARQMTSSTNGQSQSSSCPTDPLSQDNTTQYQYDEMGRLIFKDHIKAGTADEAMAYDADGRVLSVFRQSLNWDEEEWYTDPKHVIWDYSYDEIGNLDREYVVLDGRAFSMAHDYFSDGSLNSTARKYHFWYLPGSAAFEHTLDYTRDGLGRATDVSFNGRGLPSGTDKTLASGGVYGTSGALESLSYDNGINFTQELNKRLQPYKLKALGGGTTAMNLEYDYDNRGLVEDMIDHRDTSNTRSYQYDAQGRLTHATGPWGTNGLFTYDALGNILSKRLGSRNITLNYDNSTNRLVESVDTGATGTRDVVYDSRGNIKEIGGVKLSFNGANQATGLSGDISGAYRYDGNGRRVKSITQHDDGTKTTRYNVYDSSGTLIYVVQNAPGSDDDHVTNYVGMDGQTLARIKSIGTRASYNDAVTWLHSDHLGSAVSGTDESGAIAFTERYTPFGMTLDNDASNDNQAGFTGHIKDADTGLNYMQARYYDPVIGRFLSHDPVGFMDTGNPGMFNRYAYTFNNPVNMIDPNGETPLHVAAGVGYGLYRVGKLAHAAYKVVKSARAAKAAAGAATATAAIKAGVDTVTSDNASGDGTRALGDLEPIEGPGHDAARPELEELTDEELMGSVTDPKNGDKVKVRGNKLRDGNGRIKEMNDRGFSPDTEIPVDELPDDSGDFGFPEIKEPE